MKKNLFRFFQIRNTLIPAIIILLLFEIRLSTILYHSHLMTSGEIIWHCHYFNREDTGPSDETQHSHTKEEHQFYSFLENSVNYLLFEQCDELNRQLFIFISYDNFKQVIGKVPGLIITGRSPPIQ